MQTNKKSVILVLFTNISIICLNYYLFFSFFYDKDQVLLFQFLYFVVIFLPLNIVIWLNKFKMTFYSHWISIYIALLCSMVILYLFKFITTERLVDSIPDDSYFDLLLTTISVSFVQLLILLFLNMVTYIIYKVKPKKQ